MCEKPDKSLKSKRRIKCGTKGSAHPIGIHMLRRVFASLLVHVPLAKGVVGDIHFLALHIE